MISNNATKERLRIAIRILNQFVQGAFSDEPDDLTLLNQFLTMHDLTVPKMMAKIGLVILCVDIFLYKIE